jgi:hypothetical protein
MVVSGSGVVPHGAGVKLAITMLAGQAIRRLESCEILVDRADTKGFVPLTIDTTPNYVDTHEFPTAKAIWTYKAIYRADDAQVGQWSQPVSVTVGG